MRSIPVIAAVSTLLLSACGGGGGGTFTANVPAVCLAQNFPVNSEIDSFAITENLARTYTYDFLASLPPQDPGVIDADTQAAIDAMTFDVDRFVNYETAPANLISFANPLDRLEALIASDEIGSLLAVRTEIKTCANLKSTGYKESNPVLLTDPNTGDQALYSVRYTYQNSTDQITKTIVKFKNNNQENLENVAQLQQGQSTVSQLFPASQFNATGYNEPSNLLAVYGEDVDNLWVTKDFQQRFDQVEVRSEVAFDIGSLTNLLRYKFLHFYDTGTSEIYVSTQPAPGTPLDPNDPDAGTWGRDANYDFSSLDDRPAPALTYQGTIIADR